VSTPPPTLVTQLAQLARYLLPGAEGAGVALLEAGGEELTTAVTDAVLQAAEDFQQALDEGPCCSAWATGTPQRVEDTSIDPRWPAWSGAARQLGIRSVLSVPLMSGAEADGVTVGQTSQGPPVVSAASRSVFTDRQAIDTATGILMERHHLTYPNAHRVLLEIAAAHHQSPLATARLLIADAACSTP
jgi:GAF domain-containing protein